MKSTAANHDVGHTWKFRVLLAALLALIGVQPALGTHELARLCYTTLWSLVLIATIYAISEIRWQKYVGLGLGLPILVGIWGSHVLTESAGDTFQLVVFGLAAAFVAIVAVMVMRHLMTYEVTADNVAGAICAYLFIGLGMGLVYTIIETVQAQSFLSTTGDLPQAIIDPQLRPSALTYFSFVTLTTAGYGDIVPGTSLTRVLAVLEAVLGQFYIAVLVAGLVGIRISRRAAGHHR